MYATNETGTIAAHRNPKGKKATQARESQSGKQKPADQVRAFRKAARDLGCEDREDRFSASLRVFAKAKPQRDEGHKAKRSTD